VTKTVLVSLSAAGAALCFSVSSLPAQPPVDKEFAPVVKRLSGEDLPAALRLSAFVSKLDKSVRFDPELAKRSLEGQGLQVDDDDLVLFTSLYGDFDERQGARHEAALLELDGNSEEVQKLGDELLLERASFTGGVLGAWLAHLREQGKDTSTFLSEVVEGSGVVRFWGGRPPTMEGLAREAAAFDRSFRREFGLPLEAVLQGGAR